MTTLMVKSEPGHPVQFHSLDLFYIRGTDACSTRILAASLTSLHHFMLPSVPLRGHESRNFPAELSETAIVSRAGCVDTKLIPRQHEPKAGSRTRQN